MPGLKLWGEEQLTRMKQDMDRLFEALCADFGLPPACPLDASGLRLSRTDTEIVVRALVPNLSPEDFSVSVIGRRLLITGHSCERTPDGAQVCRSVRRELYLPCRVKADAATSGYENGVIEIHIPLCPAANGPNNTHSETGPGRT
ncbi:Hsp20/alpha crystallin family protein [Desulfocurvus sp. DL9XJH121]